MKRHILSAMMLLASATANAGDITYLDCVFSEDRLFKVTLNEPESIASIDFLTGSVKVLKANFGATDVTFEDNTAGGAANSTFIVNRTTLKMARVIHAISTTDTGQCTIVEAPKSRKF